MPTNFKVQIKGVSLCYTKNQIMNVIFPCDPNHRASYKFKGGFVKDVREFGRAVYIDFPSTAIPAPPTGGASPSVAAPFNMSAYYAHETTTDPSGTVVSNLKQYDLAQTPDDIVWLRIPNSRMHGPAGTAHDYFVQEISQSTGMPVEIIGKVAKDVVIEFDAVSPFTLTAKDLRDPAYSSVLHASIPLPPGGSSHELEFDNDCHGSCPKENDFLHLYRIVYDDNPNPQMRRKFAAGQIKVRPSGMKAAVPAYGNCDPVESNPPPGP